MAHRRNFGIPARPCSSLRENLPGRLANLAALRRRLSYACGDLAERIAQRLKYRLSNRHRAPAQFVSVQISGARVVFHSGEGMSPHEGKSAQFKGVAS